MTNDFELLKWHKNTEDDIFDSLRDWSYHRFVCVMKNNKVMQFSGILDENSNGEISEHFGPVHDTNEDWNYDDIVLWIEVPFI